LTLCLGPGQVQRSALASGYCPQIATARAGSRGPSRQDIKPSPSGQRNVGARRIAGRVVANGVPYGGAHVALHWPGAKADLLAVADRVQASVTRPTAARS